MKTQTSELGCSTISFRHRALPEALRTIAGLGLSGIDLGGLPGVCDHIPTPLGDHADHVVRGLGEHDVRTWAINVDPGAMNDPGLDDGVLEATGGALVSLAARLDAAIIVPCGAQARDPFVDEATDLDRLARGLRLLGDLAAERGVRLLVEGLHHHRFCHTRERAEALLERVPADSAGFVFDVSHVVAGEIDEVAFVRDFADRIEHVHLRDAVPGDINLSLGRGRADFPGVIRALREHGYPGRYVLELETHDVAEADREAAAARAVDLIAPHLMA
ncbi:sugar phosphate isomerase/epimerase [Saccharopolyspora erythraea NRRL 2338]|uniref:Xylose isomerase domain protein TIM barrel n=2 Tax=Saccharopolyspora erythraea TaxID=1836 RepID=A4FJ11_SACEN|nr:sugar phosphate isomerase/epimerase [Saccharopolyspora erythraea]EQD86141.1 xylose isomerase [Saccharopolyspora erythraea D]PFG97706.1 sugar phosphate isomerase/epimerase [Saccharopolyspora erythraea NRRL 2338]QRK87855.1 sugar phosphate isomerase/epimerase [Saccharopolyspora erythraea]CAM04036.1 xylose isomerase domain protein TIM barrel [Saccharopolyspora erythraea NRRL 2338]